MNRFAELLDRLAYEPGRNDKLRLIADYFRDTPDPDRGWALAALTGALSFKHAKPGLIRALIAERTDPVLFALSYDYVGDLSETVALMWPTPRCRRHDDQDADALADRGRRHAVARSARRELPAQLARWLDALDETGRWALLKLVTGGLRIGVSARLAKTAAAALGDKDAARDRADLARPGAALSRPVRLAGRPRRQAVEPRSRAVPPADAGACDRGQRTSPRSTPTDFIGRMEMGRHPRAGGGGPRRATAACVARLYSRTGEDISGAFPISSTSLRLPGADRRRTADRARGPRADASTCCSSGSTARPSRRS